jgi:hypothetical protein
MSARNIAKIKSRLAGEAYEKTPFRTFFRPQGSHRISFIDNGLRSLCEQ